MTGPIPNDAVCTLYGAQVHLTDEHGITFCGLVTGLRAAGIPWAEVADHERCRSCKELRPQSLPVYEIEGGMKKIIRRGKDEEAYGKASRARRAGRVRPGRWFVVRKSLDGVQVLAETVRLPDLSFEDDACEGPCKIWDEQEFAHLERRRSDWEIWSLQTLDSTTEGREALTRWYAGNDERTIQMETEDLALNLLEMIAHDWSETDRDGVMAVLQADHSDPVATIKAAHELMEGKR